MTTKRLLTRDEFRQGVFTRDAGKCVICGAPGVDAHHIMERRLFAAPAEKGGYFIDNGATVCEEHHLACERTDIMPEEVREAAGITRIVLPEHLYEDQLYDKWSNIRMPNGQRLRGELFFDESVQKIIKDHLHLFTHHVKAPRTWHLPWSPGVSPDDRILPDMSAFKGEYVVATKKMDGGHTSMYRDYIHGRALDGRDHPMMHWVKGYHAGLAHDIPEQWRICGENLFARHSIAYRRLKSYFLGFQIWDERNVCRSWTETLEWFALIGVTPVEVIWEGIYDEAAIRAAGAMLDLDEDEGYVVRVARAFSFAEYKTCVGKFVRGHHNHLHNKKAMVVVKNGLAEDEAA
jgi:hypothetical protein